MSFSFRRLAIAFVLLLAISPLSACDTTTGLAIDAQNYDIRMKDSSYMAADALSKQSSQRLPQGTPILIGTLSDINKMETSTPLGRTIAEQIGARFVQRGYTVSDVRFRNAINVKQTENKKDAGEYFLSRDTAVLKGEQDVGAVVTGTYVVAKTEVLVNLRMIEATSSRVLAAYDYRLPMTSDVRALVYGAKAASAGAGPSVIDTSGL